MQAVDVKPEQKRILVVDDEKTAAFFLSESLQLANPAWDVITASSIREALATLVRHRVDLVITDLRMPLIDGVDLLSHVRENWPETRLFLVTAYGSADIKEEARKLQVAAYMVKPVDVHIFVQKVSEILSADS